MNAVITVVGKDKVGIIHGVSGILNENNVNILNISPVSYTHLIIYI